MGRVVVAAVAELQGGGEVGGEGGIVVAATGAGDGVVGRGRPPLWFGGLGLESVEWEKAQVWKACGRWRTQLVPTVSL